MSGALFEPTLLAGSAALRGTGPRIVPGGLLAPDFDAPEPAVEDPAPAAEAAAAAEAARLEAAREAGFAAGEAAMAAREAQSRAARDAAALEAVAAALRQSEAATRSAAAEAAPALVGLLLAALAAALPEAAERLASEQAARLAGTLEPLLADGLSVTLWVAAGCGAAAAARIADPRMTVAEDAALPPGDARAAWRGGGASLSLAARQAAVAEMLACFGLQED